MDLQMLLSKGWNWLADGEALDGERAQEVRAPDEPG